MIKRNDNKVSCVTLSERLLGVLLGITVTAAWLAVCACIATGKALQELF